MPVPDYPQRSVVYVDVDGTLLINGGINVTLSDWCRRQKEAGYQLVLWSAAGVEHARAVAERADLLDVFDCILPKPGYVVDDWGWQWVRYTHSLPITGGDELPAV